MNKDEKLEEKSFEENLESLEKIVKELESGEVPLDDAIKKFSEATKYAKVCDEKLKKAENNIHKILNEDGSIQDFQVNE